MTLEHTIPTAAALTAEVNASQLVTLWHGSTPVQVAAEDVEEMRALGLTTHSPNDVPSLITEAATFAGLLPGLLEAFGTAVADGVLDPSEVSAMYALQQGARELNRVLDELLTVANLTWPIKATGETITMHRMVDNPTEGEPQLEETIDVDPSGDQIETYRAAGWAVVTPRARRGG